MEAKAAPDLCLLAPPPQYIVAYCLKTSNNRFQGKLPLFFAWRNPLLCRIIVWLGEIMIALEHKSGVFVLCWGILLICLFNR